MTITHPTPTISTILMRCLGATAPVAALMLLTKPLCLIAAPSTSPTQPSSVLLFRPDDFSTTFPTVTQARMRRAKLAIHTQQSAQWPSTRTTSTTNTDATTTNAACCSEKQTSLLE